jgi:hypothetical protein
MISHMRNVEVNSAFSYAFSNDRTLFLLLAYGLSFVIGTATTVQLAGVFLISAFCVVYLLVAMQFEKLPSAALFTVLLTPFSFQALGLIYDGYFANMLALIFVFLYFFLLLKVSKRWSTLGVFVLFGLSVLILFSHSWTWFIFALSLVGFLLLEWRSAERTKNFRFTAALIGGSIGVGLLSDLARTFLSSTSSTATVLATTKDGFGFPSLNNLVTGIKNTVYFDSGGVFANQFLVFLMAIGLFVLLRYRAKISNLLLSWIFVACVPVLFGSAGFVFDRSLFLLPCAILSGLGLTLVAGYLSGLAKSKKSVHLLVVLLVVGFVLLALLNFGIRYIFNINVF